MGKLIMLVDDSASLRQVVSIALKGAGYDVLEACDGQDALNKLNGQKVHLIVSDVNMPNMDGIDAAKILTEEQIAPVVLLTAYGQKELVDRAKEAGVVGYLVKPFPVGALVRIESLRSNSCLRIHAVQCSCEAFIHGPVIASETGSLLHKSHHKVNQPLTVMRRRASVVRNCTLRSGHLD